MSRYKEEQKRRREGPDLEPFPESHSLWFEEWNEACRQADLLGSLSNMGTSAFTRLNGGVVNCGRANASWWRSITLETPCPERTKENQLTASQS